MPRLDREETLAAVEEIRATVADQGERLVRLIVRLVEIATKLEEDFERLRQEHEELLERVRRLEQ
jgi:hypothetical protein